MSEAAESVDPIVDLREYLRDTLADMDRAIGRMQADRTRIARRLAVLDATYDPDVRVAADDYEARVREGRQYEDAEDFQHFINGAFSRFGPPD